jgi:hypothetical protein
MSLPKSEQTPDDPRRLPPARRRRARRLLLPLNADEREAFLDALAHRASPSFDFFLFSLIAGCVISVGLWLDSPALVVLGALLAPLMAPMIGLALGTVTGSMRFFARSLIGLGIAGMLVFISGVAGGFIADIWPSERILLAIVHAQLSWDDFLVLALGAILTSIWLVNNRRGAAAASVALSYELYAPLAVAGFGLGSGTAHLWPDGLVVFAVHLAWAALFGAITLALLGFRPLTLFGYTLGGMVTLIGVILLIGLGGAGAAVGGQIALPTSSPTMTFTPTLTETPSPTITVTPSPVPPSETPSPTNTSTVTPSFTFTPSPSPTPVYALIASPEGGGGIMRDAPSFGGNFITSLLNGTLVEILGEKPVMDDRDRPWFNVRLADGREGWMLQSVLLVATPEPNW